MLRRCGPCKVMLPLLEELAEELSGKADIVKFNCNAKNKELGKTLNVKVAPTFHLYKNNNKVTTPTRQTQGPGLRRLERFVCVCGCNKLLEVDTIVPWMFARPCEDSTGRPSPCQNAALEGGLQLLEGCSSSPILAY
jgi:thiol-disulfide isomerase/thioredoxin